MKKTLLINLWVGAFLLAFILIGVQTGGAVEKHHQPEPGAEEAAPKATDPSNSAMTAGSEERNGPGMMGMMAGPDEEDEGGQGMMPVMMSHMKGGAGGMKKMMKKMKSRMKGRGEKESGGMAQMARMLENLNLTPEQWDQVRALARKRLEKMVDLWAQRMKLKIELDSLRWDEKIDAQQVKDLFVKRAEAKAEMFLTGLAYMHELKKILTPEQLKTLEDQGL